MRASILALLAVLALSGKADAATVTVTLNVNGPSPSAAAAGAGDKVVFSNTDQVSHVVKATSSNWTYKVTIGAGSSSSVVLAGTGVYKYSDTHVVLFSQVDAGSVTVAAVKPSPTPTVKPSATPKPSATASPKPSATLSASPGASPTSSSGTALGPGLGTSVLPSATPAVTDGPQPNIAPVPVGSSPTPTATGTPAPPYFARGLVQGSTHRYGLPAALAVVAITGVLSLLVRLLLAQAPAKVHPES